MFWRPRRSIAGVRVAGSVLKYKPIDGATCSGLPLGCMWSSTTRSVFFSRRHESALGRSGATWPGVQPRKWPSGYIAERAIKPS